MLSRLLHPLAAAAGGAPGGAGGAVSTSTTSTAAAAATAATAAASGGVYRGTLTVMSLEHVPMEAAALVVEAAVSPPRASDPLVEKRRPRTRGTTPAGSAAPSIGSSDTDREALVGSGAGAPAPLGASPSPAPSAAAVAAAAAARRRRARTKALSGIAAGGSGGYSAFLPAAGLGVTGVSASDPGLSPSHSSVDAQSLAYLSTTSSSCGSGGVAVAVDGADTLSAALGLGRGEAGIFDADSARSGSGRCDRAGIDGHLPRAVAASRVDAAETVAAVVATGVAKAAARHSAGGVGEWEWLAAMQERVSDAFEEERMVMSRSPYGRGGGGGGGGGDDSGRQTGGDTGGRGAAVPLRGDRWPLVVADGGS
ncbi:hypothetical protein I4F81_004540 [Pyropia yezoensis]|uniref:Uncharacterized protein n=1 Tax=Pyropia yezoensis TaxID=2788 RepID=A0ACC3BVB3_PYRYE|nr:hypothetical protein I4F81_004540 [Neopyropia yezoensis]